MDKKNDRELILEDFLPYRLAILSLGPDGLPGDGNLNPDGDGVYGTGDDIFVHVGG